MSKFGLPVPPFLDDVVECTDQDGNTVARLFSVESRGFFRYFPAISRPAHR